MPARGIRSRFRFDRGGLCGARHVVPGQRGASVARAGDDSSGRDGAVAGDAGARADSGLGADAGVAADLGTDSDGDTGHDGDQFDREDRQALRRVGGLSTELEDVTEVEYRQLRIENVVLIGIYSPHPRRRGSRYSS